MFNIFSSLGKNGVWVVTLLSLSGAVNPSLCREDTSLERTIWLGPQGVLSSQVLLYVYVWYVCVCACVCVVVLKKKNNCTYQRKEKKILTGMSVTKPCLSLKHWKQNNKKMFQINQRTLNVTLTQPKSPHRQTDTVKSVKLVITFCEKKTQCLVFYIQQCATDAITLTLQKN
jgi:hypothetical protein